MSAPEHASLQLLTAPSPPPGTTGCTIPLSSPSWRDALSRPGVTLASLKVAVLTVAWVLHVQNPPSLPPSLQENKTEGWTMREFPPSPWARRGEGHPLCHFKSGPGWFLSLRTWTNMLFKTRDVDQALISEAKQKQNHRSPSGAKELTSP